MNSIVKKCPYCDIQLRGNQTTSHLKKCKLKTDTEETAFIKMVEYSYGIKASIIVTDYDVNKKSLPDIKSDYGLSYGYTSKILNILSNGRRDWKSAVSEPNKQNKYKKTVLNKYGVDNISKLKNVKEKKKKTFIKNYGVDNIFKTDDFKNTLDDIMLLKYGKKRITNPTKISEIRNNFTKDKWDGIINKTESTCLEKYGVKNYAQTDEFRKLSSVSSKIWWLSLTDIEKSEFFKNNSNLVSKLEYKVREVLDKNNIFYTPQVFVGGKSYDIKIRNSNILIEVQGDYWHANPKKYKPNDVIPYPNNVIKKAKEVWLKDEEKKINAMKYGYNVLYLWETDINNSKNNIEDLILNLLHENS